MNDDLQKNYDDLINAIFETTYDDIVEAFKKKNNAELKMKKADTECRRRDAEYDLRCAEKKVEFYIDWLKEVLPQWRDIDADKIIQRAKEVANEMQ